MPRSIPITSAAYIAAAIPLPPHVSNVKGDRSIRQGEKIRDVSAYFSKGRKSVRNFDEAISQRPGRQQLILDFAALILPRSATVIAWGRFYSEQRTHHGPFLKKLQWAIRCVVKDCNSTSKPGILSSLEAAWKGLIERIRCSMGEMQRD